MESASRGVDRWIFPGFLFGATLLALVCASCGAVGPANIVNMFMSAAMRGDHKAMYQCFADAKIGMVLDGGRSFDAALSDSTDLHKPRWIGEDLRTEDYRLFLRGMKGFRIVGQNGNRQSAVVVVEIEYRPGGGPAFVKSARLVYEPTYTGMQIKPIYFHSGGDGPLGPRFAADPELQKHELAFEAYKRITIDWARVKTARLTFRTEWDSRVKRWWITSIAQPYREPQGQPLVLNTQAAANFTLQPPR